MTILNAGRRTLLTLLPVWLAALLAGCEQQQIEPLVTDGDLSGHWYGSRDEGDVLVQWIADNGANGSFSVRFLTCYAGEPVRYEEQIGSAEFSDGIYKTYVQQVRDDPDTGFEPIEDGELIYKYRVSRLTDSEMDYQSVDEQTRFSVSRVSENFVMNCPRDREPIDTSAGGQRGEDGWIRRGLKKPDESDDKARGATPGDANDTEPAD